MGFQGFAELRERKAILIGGGCLVLLALIVSSALAPTPKSPFDLLSEKLNASLKKKDYPAALQVAIKRGEFATKNFTLESPKLAEAIADHGMVLQLVGNHTEALPLLERAVALDIKFRGPSGAALGKKMVALAESKSATGDLDTAGKLADKASTLLETERSERFQKFRLRADVVRVNARLGSHDCEAAGEIATNGLEVGRKQLPKETPLLQALAVSASKASQCRGDIAQAEAFISDAVSFARRRKSEELPSLLSLQGELLCQLGNCKRGVKLQEKGFKAAQKMFGVNSDRAAELAPTIDAEEGQVRGQLLPEQQEAEPSEPQSEGAQHFEIF
ncbi:MAG: hypothetical protein EBZ48_08755 [Proteobacteria bacterium]|nr:hypothetical protein [Pseudomonadota bacterium]